MFKNKSGSDLGNLNKKIFTHKVRKIADNNQNFVRFLSF